MNFERYIKIYLTFEELKIMLLSVFETGYGIRLKEDIEKYKYEFKEYSSVRGKLIRKYRKLKKNENIDKISIMLPYDDFLLIVFSIRMVDKYLDGEDAYIRTGIQYIEYKRALDEIIQKNLKFGGHIT